MRLEIGHPTLEQHGRFRFSERAEPLCDRVRPRVHGYRWRHPSPKACVILVHGLRSHAGWFAEAADGLVERGFSVYAPDRRGSGCSPETRGDVQRYTDWFEEIAAATQQAEADHPRVPIHLAGHCFGANLALGCVLGLRPRVRSVVMLTSGLSLLSDYSLWEKLRIGACGLLCPEVRFPVPLADEWFTRDPEVLAWIQADPLGARTLTARCLLQIHHMHRRLRRDLPGLRIPTLVLEAERDRISDNRRSRELLKRTLGDRCCFRTFDAEHFLLAEPCRDQVLDALDEWIRSQETSGC